MMKWTWMPCLLLSLLAVCGCLEKAAIVQQEAEKVEVQTGVVPVHAENLEAKLLDLYAMLTARVDARLEQNTENEQSGLINIALQHGPGGLVTLALVAVAIMWWRSGSGRMIRRE